MRVMEVTYYQEENSDWRWRVVADNGNIIGASTEGYTRRANAEINFKTLGRYCRPTDIKVASEMNERPSNARLPLMFYKGEDGDWRWRVQAANGKTVHASTEGYRDKRDATKNLETLSDLSRGVVATEGSHR